MSTPAPQREIAYRTAEGDDATCGPDHRVTCLLCRGRSGTRCEPRAMPHVPLAVKHDCAHYKRGRVE